MVEMKTRTALSAGIVFMMVGAGIAGCLGIFDWQAQAYSGNLKAFKSYNELTAFIKKRARICRRYKADWIGRGS